jgi:hypothetical protein
MKPETTVDSTQAQPKVENANKLYPETAADTQATADAQKQDASAFVKTEAKSEAVVSGDKKESTDAKSNEVKKVEEAKFDLKLPEKTVLEQAHLDAVTSYAKEKGLTPEQAQEILNRDSQLVSSYVDRQQKQFEAQIESWVKETQSDKELGGNTFKESVHLADQVVKKFGSPELIEGLRATGFGNHPELIRLLTRIGKSIDNDKLILAGSNGAGGKRSMEDIFYGSTKN